MKRLAPLALALLATSALASPHGSGPPFTPGAYWKQFANGPTTNVNVVPLLVWDQEPQQSGTFYNATTTVAAAAKSIGMTGFIGLPSWPERVGSDNGEWLAAVGQGLSVFAGSDYTSNVSAQSVSSVLTLIAAEGSPQYLIGYNGGDEPSDASPCTGGGKAVQNVPGFITTLQAEDTTRPFAFNGLQFVARYSYPTTYSGCYSTYVAAVQAPGEMSTDYYAATEPFYNSAFIAKSVPYVTASNFSTTPEDALWSEGVDTAAKAFYNGQTKPVWQFIESGGDNLGQSSQGTYHASLTSTSATITYTGTFSTFTSAWVGFPISGPDIVAPCTVTASAATTTLTITANGTCGNVTLPTGDAVSDATRGITQLATLNGSCTISGGTGSCAISGNSATVGSRTVTISTGIVSITDSTHAVMSNAATGSNASETITFGAGGCNWANDLCVLSGNEYRARPFEVNAEAWMALINGATGIEWFCHDNTSITYCLQTGTGGSIGQTGSATNVAYVNAAITSFAPEINAPNVGQCSMQAIDWVDVASSCAGGGLTISTGTATVPGMGMLKKVGGVWYLFAQSDRHSVGGAGATFTFTVAGAGSKTATVVYDSNSQYDSGNTSLGNTISLSGGVFTDTLGAHSDDYQVKIYAIQ